MINTWSTCSPRKFVFEKLITHLRKEWQNNAKLNKVSSKFSTCLGEMMVTLFRPGNLVVTI
jgi:hypothetical protein